MVDNIPEGYIKKELPLTIPFGYELLSQSLVLFLEPIETELEALQSCRNT